MVTGTKRMTPDEILAEIERWYASADPNDLDLIDHMRQWFYTKAGAPAAVALGKRGGTARAAKLTPEQRAESARQAAAAKWAKWREATGRSTTPRKPKK